MASARVKTSFWFVASGVGGGGLELKCGNKDEREIKSKGYPSNTSLAQNERVLNTALVIVSNSLASLFSL